MDSQLPNRPKTPVILKSHILEPTTNRCTPPSARDTSETISPPSKPPPNLTQSSPESPQPPSDLQPGTPTNQKIPILSQRGILTDHDSATPPRPKSPPQNPNPDFLNQGYRIPRLSKPPVEEKSSAMLIETDSDDSGPSKISDHPRPSVSTTKSRPTTPKSFPLEKTPASLIKDQPEVELIPRRHSEDQRTSQNMKNKLGDAITITPVVKRSERPKTPVLRPKTPVAPPKPPTERPKTPVARSKTPVNRSKTPVNRSKTPVERPKTPAERPKTPAPRVNPERKRRKSILVERELDAEMDAEVEKIIEDAEDETRHKRQRSNRDNYCWKCHKDNVEAACSTCVRSWHRRCIGANAPSSSTDNWVCGECASILKAENSSTRSPLMSNLTVDQLCMVLKHIITKMKRTSGADVFMKPVDLEDVSNYLDFIVKPMDLSLLERNVQSKEYGSPDAFMADAKWILHNCIVFNTEGRIYADTSKLTSVARGLMKLAREEISELESCPTCYIRGRHLPRPHYTWFKEACKPPHLLVWAKLKGFPFWPAKVMPRWNKQGHVDVRFFGEHNRAWVSPKDLFLLSEDPPTAIPRSKRDGMTDCLREMSIHIKKLRETFGKFEYAPPKTQFNPYDPLQIKSLLPDYDPPIPVDYFLPSREPIGRGKKRKSDSPLSAHDGTYYSDCETIGDFNEGDDEDESVMGKETNLNNSRGADGDKGLPEASIPGKRPRQLKPIKSVSARRSAVVNVRGRSQVTRGGAKVGHSTPPTSKTLEKVIRPRRYIPERINSEGKSLNKRAKTSKDDDDDDDQPETEAPKNSPNVEEPREIGNEEVKRHSRAKKSFPNKPPQSVPRVSLERQPDVNSGLKSPVKVEERYQVPPADAGPLSSLLNRGADTLAKQMGLIIEESIRRAAQGKGPVAGCIQADQAVIHELKLKMERMKWEHEQEMAELKYNTEKTWKEMKLSMEAENLRSTEEIMKQAEQEKVRLMATLKSKQWCACCNHEACMYCCWNTSYCSEKCQELHWRVHSAKCMRTASKGAGASGSQVNGQKEQSEAIVKPMNAQTNSSNVRGA